MKAALDQVQDKVKKAKTRWQTSSHVTRWVVFSIVLALVVGRLALPHLVRDYVNRTLDRNPDYGGRVGNIRIHLLRGAYSINHVDVVKKTGQVPVPLVSAKTVDFSVAWRDLFHGRLVSEINIDGARLNFVQGPTKEQSQTGVQTNWIPIIEDLFPFKINRCTVRRSELWYHDFQTDPQVHVYITNMLVVATNLSNARDTHNRLPAGFNLHGTTIGQGDLDLALRANPLTQKPTFDLKLALTNMDLTAINDFLRAYAKADVRQGRLDVFSEMAAADGRFEGYVKPLVTDLKVFNLKDKGPIQVIWEAAVALIAQTFKNHPHDRFGTKIPFAGSFDDPKVNVWETVVNVLRNTFIKALPPDLEGSVSVKKVEQQATSGKAPLAK